MLESNNKLFPEFIKKLPKADYSSDGAGAIKDWWLRVKTTRSFSMRMMRL